MHDGLDEVTARAAFARVAREHPDADRVPVRASLATADPFDAYRRARGDDPSVFYETGGPTDGWGYFGVNPTEFDAHDSGVFNALDALETDTLAPVDSPVPIPGGHFGWLSYDAARELESLPNHAVDDRGLPTLQVATYETLAAWHGDEFFLVATPRVDGDVDAAYDRALDALDALADRIATGDPAVEPPAAADAAPVFESDAGRDAFRERVETVKERIRAGDTFQANVSHRLRAPAAVHPVALFAALRDVNPAPYSALVEFPGVDIASASPELLLDRDGPDLATEPIAGTRPRGDTPEADDALAADLRGNEKERAEHAMLVDLERNDLGRVAAFGSVDVTDYRRVDRHPEVMHLVSEVDATLRDDATLADAIAAAFPGGTITGAPKPETMRIIDEVETTRRGPYTGSAFAVGFNGRATLNILIRTLVRHADEYHLRVGAGIVHDSDPDAEYDETLDKARGLVNALDAAVDADLGVTER
ncbi:aminodeoxychorismate synthase, component I [Halocalculus aciditolerans]|uniref:anthranilate synthase n=1 Tax=Halocalculus aciditolerans TaxID=1383812 RepID=A0A830FJY9_9EURY|nr:aminodeoxychorismate synthase, component I [Halocalculus aciditolerans]GGL63268.1 anthranilate synthase component I [Halocalculus aciditolerans]